MAVDRASLKKHVRPKKTVSAPGLGGEVILQAMGLRDRLRISAIEDKWARLAEMLHVVVVDPKGKPLMSIDEWEDYGATEDGMSECLMLTNEAHALTSGEAKKDSTPS